MPNNINKIEFEDCEILDFFKIYGTEKYIIFCKDNLDSNCRTTFSTWELEITDHAEKSNGRKFLLISQAEKDFYLRTIFELTQRLKEKE